MTPPRFATLLLRIASPVADWPWVIAELEAEYAGHVLPERGVRAAGRWFWWQAVRSIGALAVRSLRNQEWEYALLMILLASAGPSLAMEAAWSYVLGLVPYKASALRGEDFVIFCLAMHGCLGLAAGMLCTPRGLWLALPAAWLFAFLGQGAAHSLTPAWFSAAALTVLTASIGCGVGMRRIFEKQ